MDALKALVAAKRKATEEEFKGKKFLKRSEIEEQRLKKLREEEEKERLQKEAKKKHNSQAAKAADTVRPTSRASGKARPDSQVKDTDKPTQSLTREQVIRRLRRLKEPATLFGETDEERYLRLQAAEQNLQIDDEAAGGQQANIHLELQKEGKKKKTACRKRYTAQRGEARGDCSCCAGP